MTTTKTKANKLPGDALIGFGPVIALLGLILAFMTAGNAGGLALTLSLTIGGLLLVVIGYLKRIAVIIASRQ